MLLNAVEHKLKDNQMSILCISIKEEGTITIMNDGKISLFERVAGNHYLAEAICGNLSTDKNHQRLGYSLKLVNIFSVYFHVEIGDE